MWICTWMGMLKKKIWDLVKLTYIPKASQNRLITERMRVDSRTIGSPIVRMSSMN
jgi:hypothetical protein